ncbi:MAG: hypothetical protein WAW59_04450 [Patescibacteria group bacterium]
MFFRKKSTSEESNVAKKGIKKMDAVVTGVILSGIVASIYGVKKLREREEQNQHDATHMVSHEEEVIPERKKTFLERIFRR